MLLLVQAENSQNSDLGENGGGGKTHGEEMTLLFVVLEIRTQNE